MKDDILPHAHPEESGVGSTRVSAASKKAILGCLSDGITKRGKIIESIHRQNLVAEDLGVPRNLLPVTPDKTQVSGVIFRHKATTCGTYTVHADDLRDLVLRFPEDPDDRNQPFFRALKIRDDEGETYVHLLATTRNLLHFGPDDATLALDGKHNASFAEFKLLVAATLDLNGTGIIKGIFRFFYFFTNINLFFPQALHLRQVRRRSTTKIFYEV